MHVSRLNPLPLQASAPVESRLMRKKQDDDADRVQPIGEDDGEERRRKKAWLDASQEEQPEADEPAEGEGEEFYQASSAPTLPDGSEVTSAPQAEASPAEPHSPLDDLLAGIKAEPSTEHAEVVIQPKPSLDELLTIMREHPEES